jgi:hypothetical protein
MELADIAGREVPFNVRYPGKEPITVVGFGNAGLAPLEAGVRNTTVRFSGGGWLWLPDLLRHYELCPVTPA